MGYSIKKLIYFSDDSIMNKASYICNNFLKNKMKVTEKHLSYLECDLIKESPQHPLQHELVVVF